MGDLSLCCSAVIEGGYGATVKRCMKCGEQVIVMIQSKESDNV
ncbi:MAG: hypothetical protein ACK4NC_01905 [Candidatus Gracilibacteria bacterium]